MREYGLDGTYCGGAEIRGQGTANSCNVLLAICNAVQLIALFSSCGLKPINNNQSLSSKVINFLWRKLNHVQDLQQ
jgi:hypothetical protein